MIDHAALLEFLDEIEKAGTMGGSIRLRKDQIRGVIFDRINHLRRMADQAKYSRTCRPHLLRNACRLLDFEIACLREIARLREPIK